MDTDKSDLVVPSLTAESRAKVRRPTTAQYEAAAMRVRLCYAPSVIECMKCGWPVREGFCCHTCGDTNPREA